MTIEPMSHADILNSLMPSTYVKLLAQDFPDHQRLAQGLGIAPNALATYSQSVTIAQHLQCVRNAIAMANEADWHLRWGQRMAENFHGPVTLAMLSAPSLGEGLGAFTQYIARRVPYHRWRRVDIDAKAHFEVIELIDLDITRATLVEVPLMVMYEYVRTFRLRDLAGASIELCYAAPKHAKYFSRWFDCPVTFNREQNALVVPSAWLRLENPGYDESSWRSAIEQCEALHASRGVQDVVVDLSRLLSENLDTQTAPSLPSLAEIAMSLRISSRTLIRRLRGQNVTYRQIVDQVLKTRAKELLADRRYRLHEVATRLAYADPKSFRRAFKRWYGITPQDYRNSLDTE